MKIKKYILAFFLFISCSNTDKEYSVTGVVQDIKEDQSIIVIDHDSISGFMMPMVMPFNLEYKKDVLELSIGDSVKFKLVVTSSNSYATDFTILGRSEIVDDYDEFWDDEYRKKQIGERLSDVSLLDINGDSISLSSLNGKFRFISFIFTRCPIPNMCPAVVIKNGVLANNFRDYNNLELIMVSFDYAYDSPIVLKDYYGDLISIYANWSIWSSAGSISDLYTLSSEIGCEFWGIEENNIGHNLRSALIGPNMELLKVWEGDEWLAKDVRKDIENYIKIVK
jgi:protein SCO1/2